MDGTHTMTSTPLTNWIVIDKNRPAFINSTWLSCKSTKTLWIRVFFYYYYRIFVYLHHNLYHSSNSVFRRYLQYFFVHLSFHWVYAHNDRTGKHIGQNNYLVHKFVVVDCPRPHSREQTIKYSSFMPFIHIFFLHFWSNCRWRNDNHVSDTCWVCARAQHIDHFQLTWIYFF